jgi:hypothetical protein
MTEHPRGPEILAGSTLIQICIGEHQAVMNFDRELSVLVETEISAILAGTGRAGWVRPPAAGSVLLGFLGQSIDDARIEENGDLVVLFERGQVYVRRIPSGGESFQITGPGVDLIY